MILAGVAVRYRASPKECADGGKDTIDGGHYNPGAECQEWIFGTFPGRRGLEQPPCTAPGEWCQGRGSGRAC